MEDKKVCRKVHIFVATSWGGDCSPLAVVALVHCSSLKGVL